MPLWNDTNYFICHKYVANSLIDYIQISLKRYLRLDNRISPEQCILELDHRTLYIYLKFIEPFEYMKLNHIAKQSYLCIDFKRAPSTQ